MLNKESRIGLIGALWFAALAVVVASSVVVGGRLSTSAVLLIMGILPMSVVLLIGHGAATPGVARLAYALETPEGRALMSSVRVLALGTFVLLLSAHEIQGQDRSRYRNFQLGGSLSAVTALTGGKLSEARTIHARPALMQDLEWRPSYSVSGSTTAQTDPVQQVVFSFYNDQLFRMVVDYDRHRTEGMTDADMIAAISEVYGSTSKPAVKKTSVAASRVEQESGTSVAQWADADYSMVLYRSSYASGFRLIMTSRPLDVLAQTAVGQAVRLDEREAPEREIARQKKEAAEIQAAQQKARTTNKAAFKP